MLTVMQRNASKYCDGVSRRSFLKIGAMGVAGLTLADLLRLEAEAGVGSSNKALINIFLAGGPSHTDMFDLKPDAPSEFRGEFSPIKTNVSGMEICELMPRLAKMADKYSLIRSITNTYGDHSSYHTNSGYSKEDLKQVGGRPALGSVVSKFDGGRGNAPSFVSLMGELSPGFLGPIYSPYQPNAGSKNMLSLSRISADRLKDRTALLSQLDDLKRNVDTSGAMDAMDSFQKKAVDVVTSGKLADALDLDKERPDVRARYNGPEGRRGDSENLLLARRLIEAGVPRCQHSVGWLGHAQRQLQDIANPGPRARLRPERADRRSVRPQHAQGCHRHHVGRIRPYPPRQHGCRPGPLAARHAGPRRRRRHEERAGDRRNRSVRRGSRRSSRPPPRGLRHALSESRNRSPARANHGSGGSSAVPRRWQGTHRRIGVNGHVGITVKIRISAPIAFVTRSLKTVLAIVFAATLLHSVPTFGQAATSPKLTSIFPLGGQAGGEFEFTVTGDGLDGSQQLIFSDSSITASPQMAKPDRFFPTPHAIPNHFTIKIGANAVPGSCSVPPGQRDGHFQSADVCGRKSPGKIASEARD